MTLPAGLLPAQLALTLSLLQLALVAYALWAAPWRQLLAAPQRLHLILGATLFLVLLWSASAKLDRDLRMHLIGMTVVTLAVGSHFALLSGTLAQLLTVVVGHAAWPVVLANALINVGIPVIVTACTLLVAKRYGPRNPFTFMLGVGFMGGALSMLALSLTTLALLVIGGDTRVLQQWEPALLPLVMMPEGYVNGALLSGLVVYAPHWLRAYEEP